MERGYFGHVLVLIDSAHYSDQSVFRLFEMQRLCNNIIIQT